jgi:TDG/mug DNA glycosylase family protein
LQLDYFDILVPGLPIIFCGINPSSEAARSGHNFGSPSNRFWRVLHSAGFTPLQLAATDDRRIVEFGCGITAAVPRATRRAAELGLDEVRDSGQLLLEKVAFFQPGTIAFLGKAAYAALHGGRELAWGPQAERFGGVSSWILPNPSGLNRNFSLEQLVAAYTALRLAKADELTRWKIAGS